MLLFLATRWSRSTSLRRLFFSPKLSFVKARVDVQTRLQQQMKLGDTKHLRFFVVCHTFLTDHKTIHSFWVLLVVLQKNRLPDDVEFKLNKHLPIISFNEYAIWVPADSYSGNHLHPESLHSTSRKLAFPEL